MFHRFTHQANTHVKPGMTMNRWGFHFDRTQTWWENAGAAWFKYMARGQYLLREGVPVSDLLVFVGEGSPNSVYLRNDFDPELPAGINFDCVNTDVLLNRIEARDGRLVLPEGTSYRALVLKNCENISLSTLQRIHDLSSSGIPIIGLMPENLLGYRISKEDVPLFHRLRDEVWSRPSTYAHFNWDEIFKEIDLTPDLQIDGRSDINYMHRKSGKTDIYFIYNPDSVDQQLECSFRIENKIPELWDPMTGKIMKSGQFAHDDKTTKVWINLEAEESMFVVFRESARGISSVTDIDQLKDGEYFLNEENELIKETRSDNPPQILDGPWEVEFLAEHGYEGFHVIDELIDWTSGELDDIKFYSGTAIYRKNFAFSNKNTEHEDRYILDLGDVKIVAEVRLNQKSIGVSWMPPFLVDITEALKAGENQLEIRLTNQWSNKLIGDERFPPSYSGYKLEGNFPKGKMMDWYVSNEPLPPGQRTTFCTAPFYTADDELMPSGLLGPVRIVEQKITKLN
jgi:hypothetical protein